MDFLFLLVCITALGAFWGSRKLSRPHRRLSFAVGIVASVLAVPLGLLAAFGSFMCSSETLRRGALPERGLIWSIETNGCGATTADAYMVRLGRSEWWRYTIMKSYAYPVPQRVEAAEGGAVRIMIDRDSAGDDAPIEGIVIPVSPSGKPEKDLAFYRGVLD